MVVEACAGEQCQSIIHINVSKTGKLFCKVLISFRLFRMKSKIFQQQDPHPVAVFEAADAAASPMQSVAKRTGLPSDSSLPITCFILYFSSGPSFRSAQMRHQNDGSAIAKDLIDGRKSCSNLVSSVTAWVSLSSGTLKSTRIRALCPLKSKSVMVFIVVVFSGPCQAISSAK